MRRLTERELTLAKNIVAETRYEALDKLATILESETVDTFKWVRNSKCITSDGCKIDITTKKNKKTGFVEIKRIDVVSLNLSIDKQWATYYL